MIVNMPLRVLVSATLLLIVAVAAFVFLTVAGYGEAAAALPLFLGAVVPVIVRQEQIASKVSTNTNNIATALNGGLKQAVAETVTHVITRMAAQDETNQTSTVAKAATAITGLPVEPPPPLAEPGGMAP